MSVEVLRLGYGLLEELSEAIQSPFDTADEREDRSASVVDLFCVFLRSRTMKALR